MSSWKLNMTLKWFIILVFLTLDIGLFVQPYPFDPLERSTLDTSMHFSLNVECSCEQTDKTEQERWREDDAWVYKHRKDGESCTKCS